MTHETTTLHVGYLTDAIEWGGAEISLANLLSALSPRVRATVIGVTEPIVRRVAAARAGTDVMLLTHTRGHLDVTGRLRDRRILRDLRLDLLQANLTSLTSCTGGLIAALSLTNLPVVTVDHLPIWAGSPRLRRPRRATRRLIARRVAKTVAVGEIAARTVERAVGLPPGSVVTIRNGVPDHPLSGSVANARPVAGTLARLDAIKGLDVLLSAAAAVPEIDVTIIGDGPEGGPLRSLADDLGLAGRVSFTGWSSSPRDLLSKFDIFVLPSRGEGLPLSILEAMFAELPVVATDVGSVSEAVDDGVTGILVPPDDARALGDALRTLAVNPELRKRMGDAGRRKAVTAFSTSAMASAYEDLYQAILCGASLAGEPGRP